MGNKKLLMMAYMAMFMALEVVLEFINRTLPEMPQGGNISFSLIAIFLAAYLLGTKAGLIVGFGSSVLLFVFGIAKFWGWWSVALDYVIPFTVCGLAGLIKNRKISDNVEIPLGILFAMTLKFLSHYLSGAFLFTEYAPANQSVYMYSLIYNAPYNIATAIVCMILVALILPRLKQSIR